MPDEPNPSRPPVLLIHGLFGHPGLLAPWTRYLEEAGFECTVPALPGRVPTDQNVLRRAGLDDYFEAVLAARKSLSRPPVVIGHSIGGLLGQKLAAVTECAALVLLASVPPGKLSAQPASVRYLVPLLAKVLAGRPMLPPPSTMRAVPLSTLPAAEQDSLIPRLVPDSGRVFRAMTLGSAPTRVDRDAVTCPVLCVSGTADRNVSNRTSERLAARYDAVHQVHAGHPHWIVAESLLPEVAPPVLDWLHRVLLLGDLSCR